MKLFAILLLVAFCGQFALAQSSLRVLTCTPDSQIAADTSVLCSITNNFINRCLIETRTQGNHRRVHRVPLNLITQDELQASFVSINDPAVTVLINKGNDWTAQIKVYDEVAFNCR